ncbi:hypothetical protein HY546_02560 [archaeon]|nr:hypothetical protein [archaeon]
MGFAVNSAALAVFVGSAFALFHSGDIFLLLSSLMGFFISAMLFALGRA